MGAPPGGPLRTTPPELLRVTPESGSVNVRTRGVMFEFDVVTSDRSSGGTGGELDNLFLLSPQEGRPRVIWRRDRIEVRPRRGFRANTAYSVTMLPGLTDLRGNILRSGRTVIFSTGPSIPSLFVHGRVFDWLAERPAQRAFVEMIRLPDSLQYVGVADSSGQFAIGPLNAGTYAVRAILDNNNNRGLDPGELWDSVAVTVRGSSPFVELLAAVRDTIAPRLLTVSAIDSVTLSASFDRALDPNVPVTPALFRVNAADSTRLRVQAVRSRAQHDSLRAPPPAERDSAVRDTVTIEARPSRRPPLRDFVIVLDPSVPLQVGATYRVTAVNARGLLGQVRTSDRVITVPRARPPAPARDTTLKR
jgi:hypothetical protein